MKKNYLEVPYKELPMGILIPEAGNAEEYDTGSWTAFYAKFWPDRCIQCFICWIVCPDVSIMRESKPYKKHQESVQVDYCHCKGCGICAAECPVDAIEMVEESKVVP